MTKAAQKLILSPSRGITPDKLVLREQSAKVSRTVRCCRASIIALSVGMLVFRDGAGVVGALLVGI